MKIHMVKKGDTLYFISQKYNVSLEEILKLNPGITNPNEIDVGMKLKIPSDQSGGHGGAGGMNIMHQHVVKQGDTLWKLSKAWGIPLADMIKANPQLKNPNVLLTGEIVNIPKAGEVMQGTTVAHSGGGGVHALHPSSIMQGVQGWVGKLSTAPILGKTPTAPNANKAPTAPVVPEAQVAPLAPVAPVAPITPKPAAPVEEKKPAAPIQENKPTAPAEEKKPAAPIQENKPTAPVEQKKPAAPVQENKPTAPAVKPSAPATLATPKAAAIETAKKALPIEKPVEKKLKPMHAEYNPNVDLFKQYGIPATEAISLYDLPKAPEAFSPIQQSVHGGYGFYQPMTFPAQMVHGYDYGYGHGHGGWQQPVPYGHTVSPLGEVNEAPFECPPGTVFVGSYPSQPGWPSEEMVSPLSVMPYEAMVSPFSTMPNQEMVMPFSAMPNQGMVSPMSAMPNQGMVSPMSAMPNQGMVSPMSAMPNQGMVSPMSAMPNQGMVSPMSAMPNQGMVSPMSAMPNQGMVSPMSAIPNQGMVSPMSAMPNQGMVSPMSAMPNQGMVSPMSAMPNQGMVSPMSMYPEHDYVHGYGHGMVSPANAGPELSGYGYPTAGLPAYPPYQPWPQTAGAGHHPHKSDCGCNGHREDTSKANVSGSETPKTEKLKKQRKVVKKAVIRTVTSKPKKRGNPPWINR
ncbi:LysM peptidoglycan-binding domain-containing protein [Paenibacillus sp. sgz302251]|uniref:LysM peptidoglycan-binding domain-containing protein n=1 Tax=Paenibacillus sp. sgz302251 TaxID=3414493 RepID=UPI003C7A5F22